MRLKNFLYPLIIALISFSNSYGKNDGWRNSAKLAESVRLNDSPMEINTPLVLKEFNDIEFSEIPIGTDEGSLQKVSYVAATQHDDIVNLAQTLENDPEKIIEYVRDNITNQFYYGIKKGPLLTLYEKSGNDYDKCLLVRELLKAAGKDDEFYFGKNIDLVFLDNSHGYSGLMSMEDVLGLNVDFSVPANIEKLYIYLLSNNIPYKETTLSGKDVIALVRYKIVRVSGNVITIRDLTSRKRSLLDVVNVATETGMTSTDILTAAGGSLSQPNRTVTSLNYGNLDAKLKQYGSIISKKMADDVTKSAKVISGGVEYSNFQRPVNFYTSTVYMPIENFYLKPLSDLINGYNKDTDRAYPGPAGGTALIFYKNIVFQEEYSKINIYEGSATSVAKSKKIIDLNGERVWIDFDGNNARLNFGNTDKYSKGIGSASAWDLKIEMAHGYDKHFTSTSYDLYDYPQWVAANKHSAKNLYKKNNNYIYNIIYAFGSAETMLAKRQGIYAKELLYAKEHTPEEFNSDGSFNIRNNTLSTIQKGLIAEGLNIMGQTWLTQTHKSDQIISNSYNCYSEASHRIGKVAQESGFYIDVNLQSYTEISKTYNLKDEDDCFNLSSFYMSAMEHGVIQQLQNGADAVSTINALYYANTKNNPLVILNNASQVDSLSSGGYSAEEIRSMKDEFINDPQGVILASQKRSCVPTEWDWDGYGYIVITPSRIGMVISGGLNGGYSALNDWINPITSFTQYSSSANYNYGNSITNSYFSGLSSNALFSSTTIPQLTSWDPINLYDGNFLVENEDISVGDSLGFKRMYNSGMNEDDSGGLGYGWVHNYDITATERTAWVEVLGKGTAEQMGNAATSIYAAKTIFSLTPANDAEKAKIWATTALIAKWGVDGMLDNCVSIKIGKESMQFIKQYKNKGTTQNPNITEYYAAPAGSNFILEKSNNKYILSEPYSSKFTFNADNKIDNVETPFGQKTTFTYTNDKLTKVTDSHSRYLNINWSGDKITSVSDGTRTASFQYTGKNITSYTDLMNNVWTYEYDNLNRMTKLKNPLSINNVIVQNIYSLNGQVTAQYSLGLAEKVWTMSYIGTRTEEKDPLGNIKKYYYDERGFCIKTTDALGRSTSYEYDAHGRLKKQIYPSKSKSLGLDENGNPIMEIRYVGSVSDYSNNHNKIRERLIEAVLVSKLVYDGEANIYKIVITEASETLLSDTQYEYENPTDGSFPRLLKTIAKGIKSGEQDRVNTINSYFVKGTAKTNLPLSITDEKGVVTSFTYDSLGHITSQKTAGRGETYSDFYHDNPRTIIGADGVVETLTYNALGDVATTTTAGVTTTPTYDNMRRAIKTTITGNGIFSPVISEVFYDAADNVVKKKNPDGLEISSTWTAQQMKLSDTVGTGANAQTTTYLHDVADRQIAIIYNDGRRINTTYDDAGQIIASEFDNKTTMMEYDNLGRNTKTTSPLGISTSFEYDALGNRTAMTDGSGKKINYTYNSFGEQTSLTNRNGNTFEMSMNIANRKSILKTPMGKVFTKNFAPNTWDLAENVPNSGDYYKKVFSYDTAGRLATTTDRNGTIVCEYDTQTGLLKNLKEGTNTISYAHDPLGRIKTSTADGLSVNYEYTDAGKIKKIIYPAQNGISAKEVNYVYDDLGRLSKVKDWLDRETAYTYDNMNRLTEILRPNGTKRTMSYNESTGEITNIEERTSTGIPIMLHRFTYDADNRLIKNLRAPIDFKLSRENWAATYDRDNQLNTWNWTGLVPNMSVTPTHDADGNMTHGPVSERTETDFVYDTRNRLLHCNGVVYTYDAEDNRRSLKVLQNGTEINYSYVYNRSGDSSEVLIRNKIVKVGGVDKTISTYYVYGAGLEYEITFDENGNDTDEKYYHADQVGSTIALTDKSSNITDKFSYDVWGYVKHTQGTSDTPFLYVGAFGVQTDANGLINMRARYYNPTTQTFITPDPIRFEGGMNWYAYAGGNPMSNIDASGFCPSSISYNSYSSAGFFTKLVNTIQFNQSTSLNVAQNVLSGLGMLPLVGGVFDLTNAAISAARGNYGDAAMHAFSAIPGIGDVFSASKMAYAGAKVAVGSAALTKTSLGSMAAIGGTIKTFDNIAPKATFNAAKNLEKQTSGAGLTIIGHYPNYVVEAKMANARYFHVPKEHWDKMTPNEQWAANKKFLDRAIARGDTIRTVNSAENVKGGSALAREINYLLYGKNYNIEGLW